MLQISSSVSISDNDIELLAIRAQGAGGQNVNKVSSAIHLRFDIKASSLPDLYKERLLALNDRRINKDGILIIKAQRFRTQDKNRNDARERLRDILKKVVKSPKIRRATKMSKTVHKRRLDAKSHRAKIKVLRGKVTE